jgi:hypothetical protein
MISLRNIEFKLGLVLAALAFIISPLVGIISGVSIIVVLIRTVIVSVLFFGLGFGAIMLIKQFVPEFYDALNSASVSESANPEDIETGVESEAPSSLEGQEDEITEDESDSYSPGEVPTYTDSGFDSVGAASGGSKMGRHILEEKGLKYEPKIIAEAIRTMMSRDDD